MHILYSNINFLLYIIITDKKDLTQIHNYATKNKLIDHIN